MKDFIISCLDSLRTFFSTISLSFWDSGRTENLWLFITAFCGGWIVFAAVHKRWNLNGKG